MTTTFTATSKRIDAALALLRSMVGVIFIAHGAQKLFSFGLPGVAQGFEQMGIPFPDVVAPLIAVLELVGGIALVFGVLTRLVSLGLAFDMLGAIWFVHLKNGFFLPNGYEFVLLLFVANVALVLAGAGAWSLDAWLASRRRAVGTAQGPFVTGTPRHA